MPEISGRSAAIDLQRQAISGARKNRDLPWAYRPAIDGLRSIAVVSVLFFHFDRKLLGGGFVGVDVFFVISGYLLTSIFLQDIKDRKFSVIGFYQRRIARIFPAFFIVLVFTLGVGSVIYSAQDFAALGSDAAAAALSAINIKLLFRDSYFKLSADAQPIMHYWSLAVEEQFYAVFPVYLYLIARFKRAFSINLWVSVASFAACVVVTHHNPVYAFYLLPTRAWELLAGAGLAIYEQRRSRIGDRAAAVASWSGFALLLLSLFSLKQDSAFPGWIAALPVIGTVLLLSAASRKNALLVRWLSAPPAVFIGKLSYSLYLWHWPTFSFVDYQFFLYSDLFRAVLKIAITVFASLGTYYLVERPLRSYLSAQSAKPFTFAGTAIAIAALCATGLLVRNSNYLSAARSQLASGGIRVAGGDRGTVVLAGDSEASMYGEALASLARERKFTLDILSVNGGSELPHAPATRWSDVFSFIAERRPNALVFVNQWPDKIDGDGEPLGEALRELKGHVGHVILLTLQPALPQFASRQGMRDGARPPFFEDPGSQAKRLSANAAVRSFASDWVTVIDVARLFVGPEGEIRLFADNGRLTYHDSGHLSDAGAAMVRPMLDSAIGGLIAMPK